ncbi:monoacylglycerol lipase ABHD6-like isoform X2 [Peromyscus californicus insignis]|uniref:monoacylglycerol lipase ABHD6-like isoform X2 n=1 Tax=Peromyscus californicus insignis TaxID=564181 RepID=UPI0022A6B227|nr:monoacylglycerol lipase ABHD6-like isoform X2 [Peromyscus californicus insignis]
MSAACVLCDLLILQGLVDVRIPHNSFYQKLFLEIVSEKSRYSLHQNMDKIKVPTQIIWGKQDQDKDTFAHTQQEAISRM